MKCIFSFSTPHEVFNRQNRITFIKIFLIQRSSKLLLVKQSQHQCNFIFAVDINDPLGYCIIYTKELPIHLCKVDHFGRWNDWLLSRKLGAVDNCVSLVLNQTWTWQLSLLNALLEFLLGNIIALMDYNIFSNSSPMWKENGFAS